MIKSNISLDGTPISKLAAASKKKVIKICDTCKAETITRYADVNKSRTKRNVVADYCKACARNLYSGENNPAKRADVREKISKAHLGKGKNFIHGTNDKIALRKIDSNGYVLVYDTDNHKYTQEHRRNLENFLGRPLNKNQIVHHINGSKSDNEINNLFLCESYSEHSAIHSSLESLAMELFSKGVILFDKRKGKYYINEEKQILETSLGFEHVSLKQRKGIARSRSEVDTTAEIARGVSIRVPLIASCMSTVTNAYFCNLLSQNGALGIMHRAFPSDEEYVKECKNVTGEWRAAAVGVSNNDLVLSDRLIREAGINILVVDVGHGYADHVIEFGKKLKTTYPGVKLIIGCTNNVGLLEETSDFVDAIRIGVSNGSACETSNTAGCKERQFSAVSKFKKLSRELGVPVISDGSIKEPADFVKSIAAGANSAIAGKIFASCPESNAELAYENDKPKKVYAGMASRYVQDTWFGKTKNDCPEGKVVYLDVGESVEDLVLRYAGALRSGISYCGADNIKEFQNNAEFVRLV